jgi:5-methylthioribose kinase
MTPKEKAIELVNKFNNYTSDEWWEGENGHKENMKQCALISVNEILAIFYDDYQSMWIRELNFWHLVKQEIQAL